MSFFSMLPSKLMNPGQPEKEKYVRFFSEDDRPLTSPYLPLQSDQIRLRKSGSGSVSSSSSKVFQEDHETWEKGILDPASEVMITWNKIFFFTCLLTLAIDPFFFYTTSVTVVHDDIACVQLDRTLGIVVTFFRSIGDLFHFLHILVKFRTAYVAPSSRVVGRGELITNHKKIAIRYLRSDFALDLAAALPLPQILIWIIIPAVKNSSPNHYNTALAIIILLQYFPRFYLIFPLSDQITRATGFVTKTAWAGAAYNLLLYLVASHIIGSSWYLLSLQRHLSCWKLHCNMENKNLQNATPCRYNYFDCRFLGKKDRQLWAASTSVFSRCNVNNEDVEFEYGIFENALTKEIVSNGFVRKYLYSLWWGLQQLSSNGQELDATTFMGETAFAILISIVGLILFAHLIGNMQTFLQSTTARVEQWRLKRRDTEEWMRHRQLPNDLRHRVRKFMQYKWLAAKGVNEESILRALPPDLRREIQRHLCLDLVRRVPFFSQMDDQLLDAICERLSSSLSTEGTYIVCEGDPVTEMIFIIRGRLESSTTDGGRTGFFNSVALRPGEFCGEELLAWALVPNSSSNLPISTRTLRALTEVEAFVLRAEDLKFVSNQFRRMHSKKLQHTFRFHSHHWRTWATCVVQVAWRQFKRRKMAERLSLPEIFMDRSDAQRPVVSKPDEPDFSVEHYN